MGESQGQFVPSDVPETISSNNSERLSSGAHASRGSGFPGVKKRGHNSRSWIRIDQDGNADILERAKTRIMRQCSLPSRDLRLLDPLFIYPSTILEVGREKAIVGSETGIGKPACPWMQRLDGLCPKSLYLACMVKELEIEIYPVLDELASSINTLNLERVRRLKGHLLALTQRVQKVRDELEHLMDDDGDVAEMYLTEKRLRSEGNTPSELNALTNFSGGTRVVSKSAPVSPAASSKGAQRL
ncbi:hypothetical protein REPUB_Repub04eG0241100 [Reevesia pubescens]